MSHLESSTLEQEVLAFRKRMMHCAIFHYRKYGLSAKQAYQFQAIGLLSGLERVEDIPIYWAGFLSGKFHSDWVDIGTGPLVCAKKNGSKQILAVEELLLSETQEIRNAGLRHFRSAKNEEVPWLTPRTITELNEAAADIRSLNPLRWKAASTKVCMSIEQDMLCSWAGLRQLQNKNVEYSFGEYAERILFVRSRSLRRLGSVDFQGSSPERVPEFIEYASKMGSFQSALLAFIDTFGHVPLSPESGVSKLFTAWEEKHSEKRKLTLSQLLRVKENNDYPSAIYHVLLLAINDDAIHTSRSGKLFWKNIVSFLCVSPVEDEPWNFRLYETLGSHFQQLLESSFPNQNAQLHVSIAWWLADKSTRALSDAPAKSNRLVEEIVSKLGPQTFVKWQLSRSDTLPSSFRMLTAKVTSVWRMAIVAQLAQNASTLPWGTFPEAYREEFSKLLASYLVSTPVCVPSISQSKLISAHDFKELIQRLSPSQDYKNTLNKLIDCRLKRASKDGLTDSVLQFGKLDEEEKIVVLVSLRDAVYSSKEFDECIAKWLESHARFAADVESLPDYLVDIVLVILREFQHHMHEDWLDRVSHAIAYCLENTSSKQRAGQFVTAILFASTSSSLSSPLQRAYHSKWKSVFVEYARDWREYVLELSRTCEPWARARIRTASATISRLIGPSVPLPDRPTEEPKLKKATKKKATKKKATKKKATKKK